MKVLLILLLFYLPAQAFDKIDFALKGLDGKAHHLSDYKNQWILVNFWATWCPPCVEEMPDLSTLYDDNKNIIVLGVNVGQANEITKVREFIDSLMIEFPILLLPKNQQIQGIAPIRYLPTSLLISPDGKLIGQFSGVVDIKAVANYIKQKSK